MAASAAVQSPASWPATRQGRLGIRAPPEWMQPNSLSLDRSFRFSVGGGAAGGCRTCGAQPLGRLLSAQPRVALGSASRRLARPLSLWPRRAGQTISPANLHDRVYEPYGRVILGSAHHQKALLVGAFVVCA